ncbi:MAG: nitroreductase family deazaflavin-dependent oxidoreductase [Pseudomonadales bacterium]
MADAETQLPGWIAEHIKLYLTDPEKAHMWDSSLGGGSGMLPTLLLITKGRKSGAERMLPLIYKKVGDAFVVIASKGGHPSHPSWYLNLDATQDCDIRVAADQYRVKARDAEGAEREDLWQQMAEIYPPYNDYQVRAGDRQIPVVVLDVV